jgi:hypothetical protein
VALRPHLSVGLPLTIDALVPTMQRGSSADRQQAHESIQRDLSLSAVSVRRRLLGRGPYTGEQMVHNPFNRGLNVTSKTISVRPTNIRLLTVDRLPVPVLTAKSPGHRCRRHRPARKNGGIPYLSERRPYAQFRCRVRFKCIKCRASRERCRAPLDLMEHPHYAIDLHSR